MSHLSKHSHQLLFPWRKHNQFNLLIDGEIFFDEMLSAINSAQRTVLMEMYLVHSGSVLNRFLDAILLAAERGISIYLLFDDFGSAGFKTSDRERLTHSNIHCAYYNPLFSHNIFLNLYRIILRRNVHSLYRNHRKLLVIDDTTAFVGGAGIVDEFVSDESTEPAWRETMIKIKGESVHDWSQLFKETWQLTNNETLPISDHPVSEYSYNQSGHVSVNRIQRYSELLQSVNNQMYNAQQRIWFSTAYFVPGWKIRRRLKRAARSGIDVRLLLPGPISDHPAVRYVSQRFYHRLLRNGVRIFELQNRFLHSKCVLCDNWVSIGSSNFDRWNLRWNLEANQEISNERFATSIQQMFEHDFVNSIEITLDSWKKRSIYHQLLIWFWKKVEDLSHKIKNQ